MKIACPVQISPKQVASRMMFLAWQACGGPTGMEFMQEHQADEKMIWEAYYGKSEQSKVYGDYIFGRMCKILIRWDAEGVVVNDNAPSPDYQGWCFKYQTYEDLANEAIKSLS